MLSLDYLPLDYAMATSSSAMDFVMTFLWNNITSGRVPCCIILLYVLHVVILHVPIIRVIVKVKFGLRSFNLS